MLNKCYLLNGMTRRLLEPTILQLVNRTPTLFAIYLSIIIWLFNYINLIVFLYMYLLYLICEMSNSFFNAFMTEAVII